MKETTCFATTCKKLVYGDDITKVYSSVQKNSFVTYFSNELELWKKFALYCSRLIVKIPCPK